MKAMRARGEAAAGRVHGLFIGGEWVSRSDVFGVRNPYDGEWVANVAQAAAADVTAATAAAEASLATEFPAHARYTVA